MSDARLREAYLRYHAALDRMSAAIDLGLSNRVLKNYVVRLYRVISCELVRRGFGEDEVRDYVFDRYALLLEHTRPLTVGAKLARLVFSSR